MFRIYLKTLLNDHILEDLEFIDFNFYINYIKGKQTKYIKKYHKK